MASKREQERQKLNQCQAMCDDLKQKINDIRSQTPDRILTQVAQGSPGPKDYAPEMRHLCTGHFGKIYALHWGHDSHYLVTASQDGKLIAWDAFSGNKKIAITLNSAWVMTCAYSHEYEFVASGGLDNTVSIFKISTSDGKFKQKALHRELEKHDGYLSCARFTDETNSEILSASGDGDCILWDIESGSHKTVFSDHVGDVMYISINKQKGSNLFASGSVDCTCKVWDYRAGNTSIGNFPGHEQDINSVEWFADGNCVISGSDDGKVALFDMRTWKQLNTWIDTNNISNHSRDLAGVTSVHCSKSGRFIFSAYDNGHVYMWNTLGTQWMTDLEHDNRVSSLGVSPDGCALATACWDFNMRIFA